MLQGETKAAAPAVAAPAARGAWAVQGAAREAYLKAEAERKRKADEEAAAAAALNGAAASAGSGPGAAESSAPSSPVAAGAAPDEKVATALFTFGIIADIQYADADDGTNFKGDSTRWPCLLSSPALTAAVAHAPRSAYAFLKGRFALCAAAQWRATAARAACRFVTDRGLAVRRRYRNALEITKSAVRDWSKHVKKGGVAGWGPKSDMAFVAQLGDVIDGRNRSAGKSHAALATVLRELNKAPTPHFVHLIGNHELYNFARKDLSGLLPSNPPGLEKSSSVGWGVKAPAYFSFIPHEQWRVVALDAYDVSTLAPTSQDPEEAFRLLADKNPNDVRQTDVDFTAGLSGVEKRWVPYNGGLGDAQLVWLHPTLP